MPTYQYRCRDCGQDLEVVQSFTDDSLTTCPACEGSLRKIFSAVGISFKGTGFYANDARGSRSSSTTTSTSSDSSGSSSSTSTTSTSSDSGSSGSSTAAAAS
jgi:putative FmdB family regulatory protein